jgi:vancomycin permeability regulator SanA
MTAPSRRRIWLIALGSGVAACAALLGASSFVEERYRERIVPANRAPQAPVAIVFGAGLESSTEPSPILAERLDTALALYRARTVTTLLVSGDSSDRYHDEARVMRRYLVERGVPEQSVLEDPAGASTYDTCYRARDAYGVRRALLVSQSFHLPRALFIAGSLGIDAWGVPADGERSARSTYELRELFSRPFALVMVTLKPQPHGAR